MEDGSGLFNFEPPSVRVDTSRAAAERIRESRDELATIVQDAILARQSEGADGATYEELCRDLTMKPQTVTARLNDLHRARLIAPTRCPKCQGQKSISGRRCDLCRGRGLKMRKVSSGRLATIWKSGFIQGDISAASRRRRRGGSIKVTFDDGVALKMLKAIAPTNGMTCHEVEEALTIRHPTAGPAMTLIERAGLVIDTGERRDGSRVMIATDAGKIIAERSIDGEA